MLNRFRKKRKKTPSPRLRYPLEKSITLIGLMGVGKTTVGVRLARRLGLEFKDSDAEIELAAGYKVSEIFEKFGEEDFRNGERRVITRLINEKDNFILGTGGGAFMDSKTRKRLLDKSITVWLKADIDLLVERTSRRNTRPLLKQGNPKEILQNLAFKRYPIYGQSHILVESDGGPHEKIVDNIIQKLNDFLGPDGPKKRRGSSNRKVRGRGRRNPPGRGARNKRTKSNNSPQPHEEKSNQPKNENQLRNSSDGKNTR